MNGTKVDIALCMLLAKESVDSESQSDEKLSFFPSPPLPSYLSRSYSNLFIRLTFELRPIRQHSF